MATDEQTTTDEPESTEDQFWHATHHYDTFSIPRERIESLRTIHRLSGELLAAAGEPIDGTARARALCQDQINAGDEAGFKSEWLDEPERDFGGNEVDAYNAGRDAGTTGGRAALAAEVLALLAPVKPCSKCGNPIPDPQLVGAERCASCGDP